MLQRYKCLTHTLAIILLSSFVIDFSECKPQFGLESVLNNPTKDDSLLVESNRETAEKEGDAAKDLEDLEKRAWNSNFAPWGKRWGNFASWGKRNSPSNYAVENNDNIHPVEKRGWFKFNSWGKRSVDDIENDKRKWSSFASWGKRDDEKLGLNPEKRKWSSFASWGKRYKDDEQDLDGIQDSDVSEQDKRKWSSFASWGKRDLGWINPNKRKWSSFASWGKRDNLDMSLDKRWSQFSAWGKRMPYPSVWSKRRWAQFNSWGKRKWAGLATWGKRAAPEIPENDIADSIVVKLLQFFDTNGDDMLDREELREYIKTLMSLPSRLDVETT